ncbi:MAG: OmpA family protein [Planctomycetota bacterium]
MTNPRTIGSMLSLLLCVTLLTGCGRVVFTPSSQQAISLSPEQQQLLAQEQQVIQQRANQLDLDNQELESLLAQTRQQLQLMRDQVAATQDQLRATTDQLAAAQQEKVQMQEQAQAMLASVQQSSGAGQGSRGVPAIQANNTLLRPLRVTSLPGVEARQDGDVIRVSLPTDQLFPPGAAQLNFGAEQMIRTVASDLLANYPQQIIGIEGHTDGAPVSSPTYPTSHHLSVAQATAVYDAFRRVSGAPAQQLFLIGHGANHPLVSNGTEAGRQKNRRVELVIYPETIRRR